MTRCPRCREPVSQFAAGCAVCGTDLERARRDAAANRPRVAALADRAGALLPRLDQEELWAAIVLVVALAQPVLGLVLAFFTLYSPTVVGTRARRLLWVVVAISAVCLLVPATRYGVVWRIAA